MTKENKENLTIKPKVDLCWPIRKANDKRKQRNNLTQSSMMLTHKKSKWQEETMNTQQSNPNDVDPLEMQMTKETQNTQFSNQKFNDVDPLEKQMTKGNYDYSTI